MSRSSNFVGGASARDVNASDVTAAMTLPRQSLRDETLRLFGKIDVLVNSAGWDQLCRS